MLLSDRDIRAQVDSGRVKIDPYAPDLIQPSSVDVRLDSLFRVFNNTRYTHIDPAKQQDELTSLVEPAEGEPPEMASAANRGLRGRRGKRDGVSVRSGRCFPKL